jgi:hypothetical protein
VVALWWGGPTSSPRVAYTIEGLTGTSVVESDAARDGPPLYRADTPVQAVLRPERALEDAADLTVFAWRRGGAVAHVTEVEVEASPRGAFRVRAAHRAIFAAGPGEYVLSFVVRPRGAACPGEGSADPTQARARCPRAWAWLDENVSAE